MPPYEPTPELTIERVRGGRRKGLLVLTVALVVVGGLVWKPWDGPSAAVATPPFVAAGHASPSPALLPTMILTPDFPALIAPPQPPTVGLPSIEPTPLVGDQPPGGSVAAFGLDDTPLVECGYGQTTNSASLIHVRVDPLATDVAPGGGALREISWTAVLESRRLSKIFEADWQPIDVSARHTFLIHERLHVSLKAVSFDVDPSTLMRDDVMRVTLVINWLGSSGKRLDQQSLTLASYVRADDGNAITGDGCPALRPPS